MLVMGRDGFVQHNTTLQIPTYSVVLHCKQNTKCILRVFQLYEDDSAMFSSLNRVLGQ